ncbi:MAG: SDR family oxidoreductase [Anaerolineaceae bacterium]|jgi:dihydroflavonol-4-reductase|nr:SDR family oxidoreductase [Anaerolineaceae bacterium]
MIVVTGATGHVGNVLVRQLCEEGKTVRAMVLPGEDCSVLDDLGVEVVEGNVLHPQEVERAFEGAQLVFHLAGMISILPGRDERVWQVNVQGTRNVLDAVKKMGVERLVYTSSIHALKRIPDGVVIDELIPFDPETDISDYDRSKATASLEVLQAVHEEGVDAVIICPTGIVGPYDFRLSEMGRLIADALRRPLNFSVEGAFDFVDVRDVARGHILAAEHGRKGEVYILSGEQIKIFSLVKLVQHLAGIRSWVVNVPYKLAAFFAKFTPMMSRISRHSPRFTQYSLETVRDNSVISSQKAGRELGYRPRALQESLADTVRWWKQQFKMEKEAAG